MLSFSDLYERMDLVLEVRPEKGQTMRDRLPPTFQNIPGDLKKQGLSTSQYQTIILIADALEFCDIITAFERDYIQEGKGIKGKESRLLELINTEAKIKLIDINKEKLLTKLNIEDKVKKIINYSGRLNPLPGEENKKAEEIEARRAKQAAMDMKKQANQIASNTNSPVIDDVVNQISQAADEVGNTVDEYEKSSEKRNNIEKLRITKDLYPILLELEDLEYEDENDEGEITVKKTIPEWLMIYIEKVVSNITSLKGFRNLINQLKDVDENDELYDLFQFIAFKFSAAYNDIKSNINGDIEKLKLSNKIGASENEEGMSIKPQYESTTYHYLSEQIKKDTHTHRSTEVSVSFKDKYKPKTHWQLAELRRYGM